MSFSRRFTRRLSLVTGGAALSSALLLYLNYRYVSSTVNLDDERNPWLAWTPWSSLALLLGVASGVAASCWLLAPRHGGTRVWRPG